MALNWTAEKLKKLSVHERATLYANACAKAGTPGGAELKAMIEEAGLPYSEAGGLSGDNPLSIKIWEIANSPEGRAAAKAAADQGLPALAGVDPLMAQALGSDYGKHNMTTIEAGSRVAEVMRALGYQDQGKRPLPASCVARSGQLWA